MPLYSFEGRLPQVHETAFIAPTATLVGDVIVEGATVVHNCVVHGATLGAECLIANGAIVLDGARVGAGSLVAAGAVVPSGAEIPEGVLAAGVPARVKRRIAGTRSEFWVKANPPAYRTSHAVTRKTGVVRASDVGFRTAAVQIPFIRAVRTCRTRPVACRHGARSARLRVVTLRGRTARRRAERAPFVVSAQPATSDRSARRLRGAALRGDPIH